MMRAFVRLMKWLLPEDPAVWRSRLLSLFWWGGTWLGFSSMCTLGFLMLIPSRFSWWLPAAVIAGPTVSALFVARMLFWNGQHGKAGRWPRAQHADYAWAQTNPNQDWSFGFFMGIFSGVPTAIVLSMPLYHTAGWLGYHADGSAISVLIASSAWLGCCTWSSLMGLFPYRETRFMRLIGGGVALAGMCAAIVVRALSGGSWALLRDDLFILTVPIIWALALLSAGMRMRETMYDRPFPVEIPASWFEYFGYVDPFDGDGDDEGGSAGRPVQRPKPPPTRTGGYCQTYE